jgi:hypothetical protein
VKSLTHAIIIVDGKLSHCRFAPPLTHPDRPAGPKHRRSAGHRSRGPGPRGLTEGNRAAEAGLNRHHHAMKAQGLGASEIAKALKIGRASGYRVLEPDDGRAAGETLPNDIGVAASTQRIGRDHGGPSTQPSARMHVR